MTAFVEELRYDGVVVRKLVYRRRIRSETTLASDQIRSASRRYGRVIFSLLYLLDLRIFISRVRELRGKSFTYLSPSLPPSLPTSALLCLPYSILNHTISTIIGLLVNQVSRLQYPDISWYLSNPSQPDISPTVPYLTNRSTAYSAV